MKIECALRRGCLLGESPVWSQADESLYWVDIHRPSILRWTWSSGVVEEWPMPENVGSIGLARRGLVAAMRHGFATIALPEGEVRPGPSPITPGTGLRFNDGRVDRRGRFWAGTVSEKRVPGLAKLYRFDASGECQSMAEGFTIANGISWSPDDRTMYFADSWTRTVFAFDFDQDDGTLAGHRVFAAFAEHEGVPDGATVDIDGCYWVAHFDGAAISRYRPDGRLDRRIAMPVPRPTSCAFVGKDLRTMLVTSASFGLTPEQLQAFPLSGSILAVDTGTQGLADPVFGEVPDPRLAVTT